MCVQKSLACAYAVTAQCAATCAPFKSSPGTYATCCKRHAATAAAAPKPPIRPAAAAKPAVLNSRFPKPFSTGKLQQDQVAGKITKADDTNSPDYLKTLRTHVKAGIRENVNTGKSWSDKNKVSLRGNPQTDLEVIPYLEDNIDRTKNLIDYIIRKEPLLLDSADIMSAVHIMKEKFQF